MTMTLRKLARAGVAWLALGAAPAAALPAPPGWLVPFPITRRVLADHSAADEIDVFVRLDTVERGHAVVSWEAARRSRRAGRTFATRAGALELALPPDCREVSLATPRTAAGGGAPVLSSLERGSRVEVAQGPDARGVAAGFFEAPGEGARCHVLVHGALDAASGGVLLTAASADGAALATQPIVFGPERFHRWAVALLIISLPADLALLAVEVGVVVLFVLLFTAPSRLMQ